MIFIGVDPGQQGAIAVLSDQSRIISVVDMPGWGNEPDASAVFGILDAVAPTPELMVAIEEPFANPRASAISQMTQGIAYGMLLGVIGSMEVRHERIKPQEWKKALGLKMSATLTHAQKKDNSRKRASELWPAKAELFARKKDDGRAEACLIAECMRRRWSGE